MSIAQRYLQARNTHRLKLNPNAQTAADVLIAAGWVSRKERKALALSIFSVLATEQMRGATRVSQKLGAMLRHHSYKTGHRLREVEARDIAMLALMYWRRPNCPACGGTGHPTIKDSPVLAEEDCHVCLGTGRMPLKRIIKPHQIDNVSWLVSQIESICSTVFHDVNRRLNFSSTE